MSFNKESSPIVESDDGEQQAGRSLLQSNSFDYLIDSVINTVMNNFVPCPKCSGTNSEIITFTWWGGLIGPKILKHVKCNGCGENYNGKTGGDNKTNIIIYVVIVGLIFAAILFGLTAIAILYVYANL